MSGAWIGDLVSPLTKKICDPYLELRIFSRRRAEKLRSVWLELMTCLISPEVKVHKLPILQDHVLKMPFERPLLDIHAYTFECMAFPLI